MKGVGCRMQDVGYTVEGVGACRNRWSLVGGAFEARRRGRERKERGREAERKSERARGWAGALEAKRVEGVTRGTREGGGEHSRPGVEK